MASRDGEPMVVNTIARRKDGSTYPLELRLELVRALARPLVYAFGVDLTDRRKTEQRIRLLSTAVERSSDAILIFEPSDPPDATQPSRIVYANDAFVRSTGFEREELVGKTSTVFVRNAEGRQRLDDARQRVLAGESSRVRMRVNRKDETEFWVDQTIHPLVDPNGRVTNVLATYRDVTAEVLHEAALATQNDILTTLAGVARELFASLEPRTLVDRLISGSTVMTGARIRFWAALPGGGVVRSDDLTIPADARDESDAFLRAALGSEVVLVDDSGRRAAARIPSASGGGWLLEARAAEGERIQTSSVFALGLVAQYAAIAVRNVELYIELDARRSAVVELNQVKTDLIAMLAHDFKGPLTSIVGFAQILAEDPTLDAQARHWLDTITQNALRLANLATDTLALSRLENADFSLVRHQVDVAQLVRSIAEEHQGRRAIRVRIDDPEPITFGDEQRLHQVVDNLIGNAIKYSPNGEEVDVTVSRDGEEIVIAIADHGIGIPPTEIANLFARFARGSNARQLGITGTGFGLYLARLIVEKHGGSIAVESVEGKGSTFTVRLKAASATDDEDL
ncbi:MAG: ATP-binding protein, partial [Polyangiales bacterium]